MPIRKQVTLSTIAKELGVTVHTVSKALKGKPGMSEATRQLIAQTAERLGYYTREQIRSFQAEHIGPFPFERQRFVLVHMEQSTTYNRLLLQGLHARFAAFGHQIDTLALPSTPRESEISQWLETRELEFSDGLFITPGMPKVWEKHLLQLRIPKILLGFPPPGTLVDSVVWNVYEAVWQAAANLWEMGHRRLMYVGDIRTQPGFLLRWQAFCHAMIEFGGAIDPGKHSLTSPSYNPAWEEELRQKLAHHSPSAMICGIEGEVEYLHEACIRLGLRIPEDMSVVALLNEKPDDGTLPDFTRPLLPIQETGYRAADRMLWRIANPTMPFEHIRIQGGFYTGSTTAPLKQDLAH